MTSTLDIALCRKESSATVAARLIVFSPSGCKYVSNMRLHKRVAQAFLEEDGVHGCCASSDVPAAWQLLWEGFLRTAEAPLLLPKTRPATTQIVSDAFFPLKCKKKRSGGRQGQQRFPDEVWLALLYNLWPVFYGTSWNWPVICFASCFRVFEQKMILSRLFPVSQSCMTWTRWINARCRAPNGAHL